MQQENLEAKIYVMPKMKILDQEPIYNPNLWLTIK